MTLKVRNATEWLSFRGFISCDVSLTRWIIERKPTNPPQTTSKYHYDAITAPGKLEVEPGPKFRWSGFRAQAFNRRSVCGNFLQGHPTPLYTHSAGPVECFEKGLIEGAFYEMRTGGSILHALCCLLCTELRVTRSDTPRTSGRAPKVGPVWKSQEQIWSLLGPFRCKSNYISNIRNFLEVAASRDGTPLRGARLLRLFYPELQVASARVKRWPLVSPF